jgi:hypothetical protein
MIRARLRPGVPTAEIGSFKARHQGRQSDAGLG